MSHVHCIQGIMDFKWQLRYDVNRVCARRPCWRSKTIKLFPLGKSLILMQKYFYCLLPQHGRRAQTL